MACLDINSFREKYQFYNDESFEIPKGYFSRVFMKNEEFDMVPDFIVKKQSIKMSYSFIKEIIYLHQINHPNIVKLSNFSFDNGYAYIALPRGRPIQQAYWDAKAASLGREQTFLKKLVSDLVSALLFLSKYGIVHADLKVENCIYRPEISKIQLIDFGISKLGMPVTVVTEEGSYSDFMFGGPAYTPVYRDPSYYPNGSNSIRTELFSITAIVYYLLTSSSGGEGQERHMIHPSPNQYMYMFNLNKLSLDPNLRDFLEQCQTFTDERKFIEELSHHPYILQDRLLSGELLINQDFAYPTQERSIPTLIAGYNYMMSLKHTYFRSRTIFAAFELFRNIVNCPDLFDLEYPKIDRWVLFSLFVSYSLYEFEYSDVEQDTTMSDFVEMELYPLFCQVMNVSSGYLLYPTQWNAAFCPDDYSSLLHAMMEPEYDPRYVVNLENNEISEAPKDGAFNLKLTSDQLYDLKVDYTQDETPIYVVESLFSLSKQREQFWRMLTAAVYSIELKYPFEYTGEVAGNHYKSNMIALIIKNRNILALLDRNDTQIDWRHFTDMGQTLSNKNIYARVMRVLYSIMYPVGRNSAGKVQLVAPGYSIRDDIKKLSYMKKRDTLLRRLSGTKTFKQLIEKCILVENEGINFFVLS